MVFFRRRYFRLDVLINNARVFMPARHVTAGGSELSCQVNYLQMIRKLGMLMGLLFLTGGVLAFVPGVTKDGMYFGLFMVNTAHNIMHIVSGVIFLVASMLGARPARFWFQLSGAFYAALAAMGFMIGDGLIFGLIMNSRFDSWGHAGLALIMLLIGFTVPKQETE